MADYGVTPTGFNNKPLSVIVEEMQNDFAARFGSELDTSSESPEGTMIESVSQVAKNLWDVAEEAYGSFSPNLAGGVGMSNLAILNGIQRKAAQYSTVTVQFTGDAGIVVPAGTQVSDVSGEYIYETETELTMVGTPASDEVLAQAVVAQEVQLNSASITVLVSSVTGNPTVTNPDPPSSGSDEESDSELRARRAVLVARPAQSTEDAISAALRDIETVFSQRVYSNGENTQVTVNGVAIDPHSILCIVEGNDTADERESIAQAIFDSKDPTVKTDGSPGVLTPQTEAVTDSQGIDHDINWYQPTSVPTYIRIETNALDSEFPSEDLDGSHPIKTAILEYMEDPTTGPGIGDDVHHGVIYIPANSVPDHFIQGIWLSDVAPPDGTDPTEKADIGIAGDELPRFTEANIELIINYV